MGKVDNKTEKDEKTEEHKEQKIEKDQKYHKEKRWQKEGEDFKTEQTNKSMRIICKENEYVEKQNKKQKEEMRTIISLLSTVYSSKQQVLCVVKLFFTVHI